MFLVSRARAMLLSISEDVLKTSQKEILYLRNFFEISKKRQTGVSACALRPLFFFPFHG